jgi:hypothetical protein
MNRDELHSSMERTFSKCLTIAKAKGLDYAGDSDPFANFRLPEHLGLCSIERGILVRICDKVSRLSTLLSSDRPPAVQDESVQDTIRDGINYLAILGGYLESKTAAAGESSPLETVAADSPLPVQAEGF